VEETSTLPAPPKKAPKLGTVTLDSSWTTYKLKTFGISVQLPKGMKAYLDKEFDNGYRLDSKKTRTGDELHEILVWPESLAGGNADKPPFDLGPVPGLLDASGRQVHIGYFDYGDWTELLLAVPDDSLAGGYDAILDYGKGKAYFGSDDNWVPIGKADEDLIAAILYSVKVPD
jgi:hypothetical protein